MMYSSFLETVFKPTAKAKGLYVLRDDMNFIARSLLKIPYNEHKDVLRRYIDEWCKGMAESSIASYAQNLGRRRANLWLLEEVRAKSGSVIE